MDKREMVNHDLPSKICCLTVPSSLVEDPFCVSENFCYRKKLRIAEGAYRLSDKYLLSCSTGKLRRGTLCVLEKFCYQKLYG